MSPSTGGGSPSHSQWYSVTPQTRPLSISILELAPTSVTLALTRSPPAPSSSAHGHLAPAQHVAHSSHSHGHSLHAGSSSNSTGKRRKKKRHGSSSIQHTTPDSEDDDGEEDSGSGGHGHGLSLVVAGSGAYPSLFAEGQTFKDMLSHGVVVTLDGMPWSRIVAHVSDDDEEDEDEEGEWEDESEATGGEERVAEEGMANASGSGTAQVARRRRGKPAATGDASRRTRSPRTSEKSDRGPRWDRERAVVVVYDLDPSKEHEVELQIVGLPTEVKECMVPVSNAVLIPPASPSASLHPRSRANSLRSRSRPRSRSNSVNAPHPAGPSPLGTEVPASPGGRPTTPILDQHAAIPTAILSPQDAQAAQTRQAIAAAIVEREHLQVQIKEARKMAQRSEAALRTEIEALKKSNEKAGSNDQRNKQKYLALQEQVKQGWAGAEATNEEAGEVKAGIPELETKLKSVTADLDRVRGEWREVKKREEEARELDRKNRAEEDKRLADVANKLDKLRTKRDKKETERAELQKKLDDLERQREEVERKADEEKNMRRQGYYPGMRWDAAGGAGTGTGGDFGSGFDNRNVSSHSGVGFSGPNFRPRGNFQHRFPSGGRPPPSQPSPTIGSFYPNAPPSPAWNSSMPKTGPPSRVPSGAGTNPAAPPFTPSAFGSPGSGAGGPGSVGPGPVGAVGAVGTPANQTFDSTLHTALMPPQLQHRIYLPNSVRPRPAPNFHPPPSVLAEQAAQAQAQAGSSSSATPSPSSGKPPLSAGPSFPPLPGQSTPQSRASSSASGPSLASIVTRAVLAPNSALASGSIQPPPPGRTATQHPRERPEFPPLSPSAQPFTSPARTTPPKASPPPGL